MKLACAWMDGGYNQNITLHNVILSDSEESLMLS